jgi:hypothetical protein
MMKIKLSETTPIQIDYLVAKCEGYTDYDPLTEQMLPPRKEYGWVYLCDCDWATNWDRSGPIIEREKISVLAPVRGLWRSRKNGRTRYGPTPLIAAMRCYCCSKLGDEVDIPEELCQQQNS